jgi:hypothetical protein
MFKLHRAFLVAAVTCFATAASAATVIDTGVGLGGTVDPNWTITASTGTAPLTASNAYIAAYNPPVFPFNYWSAPLLGSQWITPTKDPAQSFDPTSPGFYTYTETLTATAGEVIKGQFLADNAVSGIVLIGGPTLLQVIADPGGNFTTPTSFSFAPITAAGKYTLSFTVDNFAQNGGNPSSLDVGFSQQSRVGSVPEPSTWIMMILGFCGVGFLAHRSRDGARFRFA